MSSAGRRAKYVVDTLLLATVIGVFLTGLLIDQLDLNRFRLHAQVGYAMTALATIHVAMHWRQLVRYWTPAAWRKVPPPDHVSVAVAGPGGDHHGKLPITRSRRNLLAALASGVTGATAGWFAKSQVSPNPYDGGDVGIFYHRESALGVRGLLSNLLSWGNRPNQYKDYSEAVVVALPAVAAVPDMTVAQAMQQRRSLRNYADRALTAAELAWIVRAATGITSNDQRRTAPSAGALYPVETYVAVNRVEGIEAGLYHVDVREQALETVRPGPVGGDLLIAGLGQEFLREAPVVLVLSGFFQRSRWKYRQRHYRYVCWESGHIAQNVYLAAEAAGMGACVVGAFFDGNLNDLLRIDGREEAALGFIAVGPR